MLNRLKIPAFVACGAIVALLAFAALSGRIPVAVGAPIIQYSSVIIRTGAPTAGSGYQAAVGSIYVNRSTAIAYVKSGSAATSWSVLGGPGSGPSVDTLTTNDLTVNDQAFLSTVIYDSANTVSSTGTINNVQASGSRLYLSGSSAKTVTGIKCRSGADCSVTDDGMHLTVCAYNAKATLAHDDSGSTASNRILGHQNIPAVLEPAGTSPGNACTTLEYDGNELRWRTIGPQLPVANDYRGVTQDWYHECLGSGQSFGEYAMLSTGTNATIAGVDGQGRIGICDLQTGTTSTGAGRIFHSGFGFTISLLSEIDLQAVVGFPTLSTGSEEYWYEWGCRDSSAAIDQTNGCYVVYSRANTHTGGCNTGNANKFEFYCANNGTRTRLLLDGTSQNGSCSAGAITTVDSSVAALTLPNTNIYHMRIFGDSSSMSLAINGTTRATITTNIPSAVGRFCADSMAITKTVGNTSRSLYVDRIAARVRTSAARSP